MDLDPFRASKMERKLRDIFFRAFGTTEESQIAQLLMFEASVDMFPLIDEELTGEAGDGIQSSGDSYFDPNDGKPRFAVSTPGGESTVGDLSTSSSRRGIAGGFGMVPLSLDLGHWFGNKVAVSVSTHTVSGESSVATSHESRASNSINGLTESSPPSSFLYLDLHVLGCRILRGLSDSLMPGKPKLALAALELMAILLQRRGRSRSLLLLQKDIALLSGRVGKSDVAIKFGVTVLEQLGREDVSEIALLSNLLSTQYCDIGRYEAAIDTLRMALRKLQAFLGGSERGDIATNATARFQRQVLGDPLQLHLARILLEYGCAGQAAQELQCLLSALNTRADSVVNASKKVSVLSWLLQAYLELDCAEVCKKIIVTIKNLRAEAGLSTQKSSNSDDNASVASKGSIKSSASVTQGPSLGWNPFSSSSSQIQRDRELTVVPVTQRPMQPITVTDGLDAFEANLPKYCIASHNADLGEIISRVYFQSRLYVSALKSLVSRLPVLTNPPSSHAFEILYFSYISNT